MATKILRRDSHTIYDKSYLGNTLVVNYPQTNTDSAKAIAVFSRKKPDPLTATPFEVEEIGWNRKVYSLMRPAGLREGWIRHVYGPITSDPFDVVVTDVSGLFSLNKARHKISGANQDLGESLVELDQTIKLIKKNLDRIGKIGDALRKGEWSKLDSLIKGSTPDSVKKMKPSKRLANGYSEIMFGIMPLLSSSHTAVSAYASGILTRGTSVSAVSGQKTYNPGVDHGSTALSGRASFSGTVKNPNIATLNSYGLVNPALMAWQRLPYSFVIDWFVPIGTILGSLTAEAGLENTLQTYTDIKYTRVANSIGYEYQKFNYYRKPFTGVVPIGNPFGRPAQLSIGKLISSVALLRQRFP